MHLYLNISEPQQFIEASQSYFPVPDFILYESDLIPIQLTIVRNNKDYGAIRPHDVLIPMAGETMSIALGSTVEGRKICVQSQSLSWLTSSNAWTGSLSITGSEAQSILENGYPWYLEVQSAGANWVRTLVQQKITVLPTIQN